MKDNNRRKFIVIANMYSSLSAQVEAKLASLKSLDFEVVQIPREHMREPEIKPIMLVNNYKYVLDETALNINPHSTGGKHKGGKKNKRNKRW